MILDIKQTIYQCDFFCLSFRKLFNDFYLASSYTVKQYMMISGKAEWAIKYDLSLLLGYIS